ncbi:N5-glutamine methyltransferase family protein [Brevibacterium renqingii]|uniref:N5-glutamine methyltransferase family protein n=1 Tax=Brevibacterium renqingii TaxID=2776916 RepID=UPI0031B5BFAB
MKALRSAGCVFAEDEATVLLEAATLPEAAALRSEAADASADPLLDELATRRMSGEPLEQIVGWVDFAGLRLQVRPGVFVPRQRTRLLAEASVRTLSVLLQRRGAEAPPPVVLEAFCGVGPVGACVAASVPEAHLYLGDEQAEAVECAVANAWAASGVKAHGHRLDCLHGLPDELRRGIDVIAAVPPYVPQTAADFLPREAVGFEPRRALFGGADGLDLVHRLIDESADWLSPGGTLLIEVGREQARAAAASAAARGMSADSRLGEDDQTVVLELRPASSAHSGAGM